jgi:hypothetical protein
MLPMLERAASFRHVRRLVIDGHMRNDDDHEHDPGYQWQRPKMSDTERGVDGGAIDTPWDSPFKVQPRAGFRLEKERRSVSVGSLTCLRI